MQVILEDNLDLHLLMSDETNGAVINGILSTGLLKNHEISMGDSNILKKSEWCAIDPTGVTESYFFEKVDHTVKSNRYVEMI